MYYIVLILLIFNTVFAESFDEFLEDVLSKNNYLKSYYYQSKMVEGDIIKAKSFKNPEIYTEFSRIVSADKSGFNITQATILQPLSLWNIRNLSVEEAKFNKDFYSYDYLSVKNKLIADSYRAFYNGLYIKEILRLKEEEFKLTENIYQFVNKMYQLGEITKIDFLRASKELKIGAIELEKAKTDYQSKLIELSTFSNKEISDIEGDFYKVGNIGQFDIQNLPLLQAYQSKVKSLEYSEKVQKALAKPDIKAGIIVKEASYNRYEAGIVLNFTLPVFYQNLGEIVKIQNEKASYQHLYSYYEKLYTDKINSIKIKYETLLKQANELDKEIIPQLKTQLELSEKSYKYKEITLFEITDIKRQYFESLRYKASIFNELHNLYADYLEITGGVK